MHALTLTVAPHKQYASLLSISMINARHTALPKSEGGRSTRTRENSQKYLTQSMDGVSEVYLLLVANFFA